MVMALLLAGHAYAATKIGLDKHDPNNIPPPSGSILDLAPGPILFGAYHQYTVNYSATGATTNFTWLFRSDPGLLAMTRR
jgi:hypothetical protein